MVQVLRMAGKHQSVRLLHADVGSGSDSQVLLPLGFSAGTAGFEGSTETSGPKSTFCAWRFACSLDR